MKTLKKKKTHYPSFGLPLSPIFANVGGGGGQNALPCCRLYWRMMRLSVQKLVFQHAIYIVMRFGLSQTPDNSAPVDKTQHKPTNTDTVHTITNRRIKTNLLLMVHYYHYHYTVSNPHNMMTMGSQQSRILFRAKNVYQQRCEGHYIYQPNPAVMFATFHNMQHYRLHVKFVIYLMHTYTLHFPTPLRKDLTFSMLM